jgi:hypothetical protein
MTARFGALAGVTARGALLLAAALSLAGARPARADGPGQFIINEENDAFSDSGDRHYTQGLRLAYLSSPVTPRGFWDAPFNALGWALPMFDDARPHQRRYLWTIAGQSLFTPEDTERNDPDPIDRPYAAWLYTGASLMQDTEGRMLENFEVLAGIVGPDALGRQTQNDFHQFISVGDARGWDFQIKNEPGVMVSYERKYRLALPLIGNFGFDAIPEAGITLGNVMTYGSAGILFRMGQNLGADYGPARIRPSISGNGWFDRERLDGAFGWQVFAGAQGRAVGYNIFLDGNTGASSRHVERKVLVGDLMGGASLFWADIVRLDLIVTQRSPEFDEQRKPDRFAGINVTFRFF